MITAIDIHTNFPAASRMAAPWTSKGVPGAAGLRGNGFALASRYAS